MRRPSGSARPCSAKSGWFCRCLLYTSTTLTAGELGLIHEHPETGYIILKDIPFSWPIAEIVRQHHERLDGSGYPLGLKEDAILPEACLLYTSRCV